MKLMASSEDLSHPSLLESIHLFQKQRVKRLFDTYKVDAALAYNIIIIRYECQRSIADHACTIYCVNNQRGLCCLFCSLSVKVCPAPRCAWITPKIQQICYEHYGKMSMGGDKID